MPLLGAAVVIGVPPKSVGVPDDYPRGGSSISEGGAFRGGAFRGLAGPSEPSRGTVSGSPPVQALKRYQEGFASRSTVSSPAESQNWQEPLRSAHENHQTPPMFHVAAVDDQHRHRLVDLARLAGQAALPARLVAVGAPAQLGQVERRVGVVVGAHDPPQVDGSGPASRPRRRRRDGARPRRRSASRCPPGRGARGSRRRRCSAGSAAAARRGHRPGPWTLGPLRAGRGRRRAAASRSARGSVVFEKVTMFSSFQISQERIGR